MDPVLTNLASYGGKYFNQLIGQIFVNLQNQEITVLEDIKGKTWFPKLSISKALKPYTGTYAPADITNYTARALDPQMFQFDLNLDPRKYRTSYQTEMIEKNAKATTIPYENFFWMKVIQELAAEIVQSGLYYGVQGGSDSDTAKNIFTGFQQRVLDLITAGLAAITTGSITSSNAVAKFETFYTTFMATNPALRSVPMNLYIAHHQADNYVDSYRTTFAFDPGNFSDETKPIFLKKSKGLVKITPVDWLGTSNRIILTPKANMVMGTDKLSDMNAINIVQDVYALKCGISGTVDTQIIDPEVIAYNELS